VPESLYEAASLDGAGSWARFVNVTLPMISPAILFNLVVGMINSFQIFTTAYVIAQGGTPGGPVNSTLFLVIYLYNAGFHDFQMGYASALAWLLLLTILATTLILLRVSRNRVYYESER
jgi:multiple sugar transport system permease protein